MTSEALNALKGLLDDAHGLAVNLQSELRDAADLLSEQGYGFITHSIEVRLLADAADDLANRIDRRCTALRGS